MPKPIKRRELIRRLARLGWRGPFSGGSHQHMEKGERRQTIPNPHGSGDVDWTMVKRMLRQAEIDPAEWDQLGR